MAINPSEFNRRAVMKSYTFTEGDAGGATAVPDQSIDIWCKVEGTAGSTNPTQGQIKSDADYKVTLRYNADFTTDWIFEYEGMDMKIKNIDVDTEGYKRFMIFYCSTTIQQS